MNSDRSGANFERQPWMICGKWIIRANNILHSYPDLVLYNWHFVMSYSGWAGKRTFGIPEAG